MPNNTDDYSGRYDVIIVGAGSAGSVMATRLSEDEGRRVLLIESGPETPASQEALETLNNALQPGVHPDLNWRIPTKIKGNGITPLRGHATIFEYEGGKLLGGSSAINAALALRGAPEDYDEWASECGEDWAWDQVLPVFRAIENDPDGSDELHGRDGPIPVRREGLDELRPLQAAHRQACLDSGYAETADHNDYRTTGVGCFPKNMVDGVRMSTKLTYLAEARVRSNLEILTDAYVHRLTWSGDTCCDGVEVEIGSEIRKLLADKVIITGGALHTPAILMRSGIGKPRDLEALGISVRSPLHGVGSNLMDHPVVGIWGFPTEDACTVGEPLRQILLRYTSSSSGYRNDMHMCLMAGQDIHVMYPQLAKTTSASTIAGLTTTFNKSTSRGSVRLSSSNPHDLPDVYINCLGDEQDIPPLMEGVRIAWELLQHPELKSKFSQILAWTEGMIKSDVALRQGVLSFVRPAAHLGGSAKMGISPENGAVVDPEGRVYGIQNVWVCDASVMPRIPNAPPHLSVLMIAEKLASKIMMHN